tara:strand:+ start:6373 stop:6759 length:387 start_codon:yes stop_codon:yes gene_type:complete
MEPLILERQLNFPSINFDPNSGMLKIIGRSIPEDPVNFYQPLENWISDFIDTKPETLTLFIYLDYLNTHSTECVLILIKKIDIFYKDNKTNVKVVWNFDEDDEDLEDLGDEFASIIKVPFEYIKITKD